MRDLRSLTGSCDNGDDVEADVHFRGVVGGEIILGDLPEAGLLVWVNCRLRIGVFVVRTRLDLDEYERLGPGRAANGSVQCYQIGLTGAAAVVSSDDSVAEAFQMADGNALPARA